MYQEEKFTTCSYVTTIDGEAMTFMAVRTVIFRQMHSRTDENGYDNKAISF